MVLVVEATSTVLHLYRCGSKDEFNNECFEFVQACIRSFTGLYLWPHMTTIKNPGFNDVSLRLKLVDRMR